MKRTIMMMSIMASFFLIGCSNDKGNDSTDDLNLSEKIIGKWMTAQISAQPAPTDDKIVITFESANKAYISASRTNYSKTFPM